MKSGKCPKCGSNSIHHKPAFGYRGYLTMGQFSAAQLEDFVCVGCGFTESYVLDAEQLKIIKAKWEPAGRSVKTAA